MVAVLAATEAEQLLDHWRSLPDGDAANRVGTVTAGPPRVVLQTSIGGERILEELEDDPLPRIC